MTTVYPQVYNTNQLILITICYIRPLIHNTEKMPFHYLNFTNWDASAMTTPTLINNKWEEMCQFFKKHVYTGSTVTTGKHRAQEIDRGTALQTSPNEETDRITFTFTYHPQIKTLQLKNFRILRNDPETKHIFSLPAHITFKRDKNVDNFLIRSPGWKPTRNLNAQDAKLVPLFLAQLRSQDPIDLRKSLTTLHAYLQMPSIA